MNEKLESQLLENKKCQDELARYLEAKTKEIVSIELPSFIEGVTEENLKCRRE
jgi:hypothetical protein